MTEDVAPGGVDAAPESGLDDARAGGRGLARAWSWLSARVTAKDSLTRTFVVGAAALVATALVVPALTRQWQDRQRARDVDAGLIADISSATATALSTAQSLQHQAITPDRARTYYATQIDWRRRRSEITGRLAAYVPAARRDWLLLANSVDLGYRLIAGQARVTRLAILHTLRAQDPYLRDLRPAEWRTLSLAGGAGCAAADHPSTRPGGRQPFANACFADAYAHLVRDLEHENANVTRQVLAHGVTGYSRSFLDALRDDL